ncbi:MAG TPA: DUF1501 domain-containing protein [Chthonomonadaceae bacterium]|nr:DUF1501 domain-containing protein [Chthonomonadaceae bacterium]
MERPQNELDRMNRRAFLCRAGASLGTAALWGLLSPQRAMADSSGQILPSSGTHGIIPQFHYPPRIKRIIQLYMAGGPSHLETFDYKPKLAEMHGQPMPESLTKGQPIAQLQNSALRCFAPQHAFKRFGQSGQEISEIFPLLGQMADDLCIVRSMHTEAINHDPAHTYMNTGTLISGRPSMGSWILYGLGTESQDLPGFVVLVSTGRFGQAQPISARQWHSGFLPSKVQGIELRGQGDPVMYVKRPVGVSADQQQDVLHAVEDLNRLENNTVNDPEIVTRIAQYELAFRMQTSVPELMDVSKESKSTLELYGTNGGDGSFSANCLLARRLAERGVRFIQLYHRDWDHHGSIKVHVEGTAREVDRGMYALLTDLKARGMLDETLVVWNGEFGRTPMAQGDGRDHHMKAFSIWLAGGGIKGGLTYGATDEFGYNAVEDVMHVNDLHATILRLIGIDHKRLTYRFQGRDFRLTDVAGNVIDKILA